MRGCETETTTETSTVTTFAAWETAYTTVHASSALPGNATLSGTTTARPERLTTTTRATSETDLKYFYCALLKNSSFNEILNLEDVCLLATQIFKDRVIECIGTCDVSKTDLTNFT